MYDYLRSDPLGQYPDVFKQIKDFKNLAAVDQTLNNDLADALERLDNNNFIMFCDLETLTRLEEAIDIIANPETESIDFRRKRCANRYNLMRQFTYRFLAQKLDEIIGKGKYSAYMNAARTILTVESSAESQEWYTEIEATIQAFKPASVKFINKPTVPDNVIVGQTGTQQPKKWNYKLGSWGLGQFPFYSFGSISDMEGAYMVNDNLLNSLAVRSKELIGKVLINNSLAITDFITSEVTANKATIEYDVEAADITEAISNIKIQTAAGETLTEAAVYIPMVDSVRLKHTIAITGGTK